MWDFSSPDQGSKSRPACDESSQILSKNVFTSLSFLKYLFEISLTGYRKSVLPVFSPVLWRSSIVSWLSSACCYSFEDSVFVLFLEDLILYTWLWIFFFFFFCLLAHFEIGYRVGWWFSCLFFSSLLFCGTSFWNSFFVHCWCSVALSCQTLWHHGPHNSRLPCPSPGPGVAQTHVHWVDNTIQPSHPLLSPCPPAFSLSQHQGLFQ